MDGSPMLTNPNPSTSAQPSTHHTDLAESSEFYSNSSSHVHSTDVPIRSRSLSQSTRRRISALYPPSHPNDVGARVRGVLEDGSSVELTAMNTSTPLTQSIADEMYAVGVLDAPQTVEERVQQHQQRVFDTSRESAHIDTVNGCAHADIMKYFWNWLSSSQCTLTTEQKLIWKSLREKPFESRLAEWSLKNVWRPFKSKFQWIQFIHWISHTHTHREWTLLVKFLNMLCEAGILPSECRKQIRDWHGMEHQSQWFPFPKDSHDFAEMAYMRRPENIAKRAHLNKEEFRILHALERGESVHLNDGEIIEQIQVHYCYTPCYWALTLSLLIPNACTMVDNGDVRDLWRGPDSRRCRRVAETPAVQRLETWLRDEFVNIRDGRDPLLLETGRMYILRSQRRYVYVVGVDTIEHPTLQAYMLGGMPTDKKKWPSHSNRRPVSRIRAHFFCPTDRILRPISEVKEWIVHTEPTEFWYGCAVSRDSAFPTLMDRHDFEEWMEDPYQSLDWERVKWECGGEGERIDPLFADFKNKLRNVELPAQRGPVGWQDRNTMLLCLAYGFDGFQCQTFSNKMQSLEGHYWQILNYTSGRTPLLEASVHRSGVPLHLPLQKWWAEQTILNEGVLALRAERNTSESGVRTKLCRLRTECVAFPLDKEMLDPMQMHIKSASKDGNQWEGSYYIGKDDSKKIGQDFVTMDGRFWVRYKSVYHKRRRVLGRRWNFNQWMNLSSAMAWSRTMWVHLWLPNPREYCINYISAGIIDLQHTWATVFELMRARVCAAADNELKDRKWRRTGETYVRYVARFNNLRLCMHPLGFEKGAKEDLMRAVERTWWTLIALGIQNWENEMYDALLYSFNVYLKMHNCPSRADVAFLQGELKDMVDLAVDVFDNQTPTVLTSKFRMLRSLAFTVLPLWRSTLCRLSTSIERSHGHPKKMLSRHSNNRDDSLKSWNKKKHISMGVEYMAKGGGIGENLGVRLSSEVREMLEYLPLNDLPLSDTRQRCLRFDVVAGREVNKEMFWNDFHNEMRTHLERWINESGESEWRDASVVIASRIRLTDWENTMEYVISRDGVSTWLLCCDENTVWFALSVEEVVKLIRKTTGAKWIAGDRAIWLLGECYMLKERDSSWSPEQVDIFDWKNDRCERGIIPASAVVSPLWVEHVHVQGVSLEDGCDMFEPNDREVREDEYWWDCDLDGSEQSRSIFHCKSTDSGFQPRVWHKIEMQDVVYNKKRACVLNKRVNGE